MIPKKTNGRNVTILDYVGCRLQDSKGHFYVVFEKDMDLTTLFYNLREEVSCSVCSDIFTDPKHLSCLHSFCLKCLVRWYETRGGGEAIKCPKCQTLSRIPASGDLILLKESYLRYSSISLVSAKNEDLPTSFYLNGFIDVY